MKNIVLYLIFNLIISSCFAQSYAIHKELKDKNIIVDRENEINTIIDKMAYKYKKDGIIGYRVQIYSNNNRSEAIRLERIFKQKYDNYKIKLEYEVPNFKLRVGNFRNKIEAQELYHKLREDEDFEAVLIVKTEIDFPSLD